MGSWVPGWEIMSWLSHCNKNPLIHKLLESSLLQLTTDKKRPVALSFYEKLGFRPTHKGMKLTL
jgi:hypothetical protein